MYKRMEPKTRLFLLRHAEVDTAYRYVFGGRIDMGLSPRGHEQAQQLADHLRETRFDALYVSPLQRVRQTARALLQHDGRTEMLHEGLREVDFGAWTGLTWQQVSERFGRNAFDWLHALHTDAIPEAEPFATFKGRVGACLDEVLQQHQGQTVALVCHGGVIRMLLALLLDLPLHKTSVFEVDYASLTVVDHKPRTATIQLMNFRPWHPHL